MLVLIRHGKAEDGFGKPDEERELTDEGRKECQQFFRALKSFLAPIDSIVSSPLVRAVQTADILAGFYPKAKRKELEQLSPWGEPVRLDDPLREMLQRGSCALVSHEPFLSHMIGYLLSGNVRPLVEVKKGGVSVLEYLGPTVAGGFCLQTHISPKLYRLLSES